MGPTSLLDRPLARIRFRTPVLLPLTISRAPPFCPPLTPVPSPRFPTPPAHSPFSPLPPPSGRAQPECLCSDIHGKWQENTHQGADDADAAEAQGAQGPLDVIAYEQDEFDGVGPGGEPDAGDVDDEAGSDLRDLLERARGMGMGGAVLAPLLRQAVE